MSIKSVTVAGLILFLILSISDLCLTWALIRRGGGRVYESNPVAHAWLSGYGWHGLAGFKGATVLVFAGIVLLLLRHRPRASLVLVMFGCMAVGWVVVYSYRMLPHVFG